MERSAPAGVVLLALAAFAGATNSVQSFLNGRLAGDLGSSVLAATVNNGIALGALVVVAASTRASGRLMRWRTREARPRWWHIAMAANGAAFVIISTSLAPRVGIALLTVAIVCGQSSASLLLDRFGLNPGGHRRFTKRRLAGAALAVAAVAVGAVGGHGDAHAGLLALGVAGGAAFALQQMAVGYVAKATGEPLAGAFVGVAMAGVVIAALALVATGGSAPAGWSAPPAHWLGGLLGAVVVMIVARVVGPLGALRLTLALVAGQSVGALVLDVTAPAGGDALTTASVVSVLLTLLAVVVGSAGGGASSRVGASPRTPGALVDTLRRAPHNRR